MRTITPMEGPFRVAVLAVVGLSPMAGCVPAGSGASGSTGASSVGAGDAGSVAPLDAAACDCVSACAVGSWCDPFTYCRADPVCGCNTCQMVCYAQVITCDPAGNCTGAVNCDCLSECADDATCQMNLGPGWICDCDPSDCHCNRCVPQ
jgi:hypothetical protein